MEQLLKFCELEWKVLAEQDNLILLLISKNALFLTSVTHANFCLTWFPVLCLLISTKVQNILLWMWTAESVIYFTILPIVCSFSRWIIISYIPRRKGRKDCGLVIGEAVIGVPHNHPSDKVQQWHGATVFPQSHNTWRSSLRFASSVSRNMTV